MVQNFVKDEPVLVSYGDCLSDINIRKMVELHKNSARIATFAVAHPTGRNESLSLDVSGIYKGMKKYESKQDVWVNACSMVLEPKAFYYLGSNLKHPAGSTLLECLAQWEQVQTYCHEGFWSPVETIRDKTWLERLWANGQAPWKVWEY